MSSQPTAAEQLGHESGERVIRARFDILMDTVAVWSDLARDKGFGCIADALNALPAPEAASDQHG